MRMWELSGNYGRNVGIMRGIWELGGNYGRNVGIMGGMGIMGDMWELWEDVGVR